MIKLTQTQTQNVSLQKIDQDIVKLKLIRVYLPHDNIRYTMKCWFLQYPRVSSSATGNSLTINHTYNMHMSMWIYDMI